MEDEIVATMLRRYQAEIPEYAAMSEQVLAEVEVVTRANSSALLAHLTDGVIFGEASGPTQEGAARRARQGVSLEAFLHACRLWGQVFWQTIREVSDENDPEQRDAALQIAGRVMAHVDAVSISATRAYFDSARSHWSSREVMRGDLIDALIAGRGSTESVRRKLEALELRAASDYVVVLARTVEQDEGRPDRVVDALSRMLDAARIHLVPDTASVLLGVRHSEVVALYPATGQRALAEQRRQVEVFADAVASLGARVGVGSWHPGLSGVVASYNEAREAVAAAVAGPPDVRVVRFDSIVVDHMLRSSPGAHDLLGDIVAQLAAYDSRRNGQLLETLGTYLASGGSVKRTADAMHVHHNTVIYRLRRIGEITGRSPTDPEDRVVLSLAVRLDGLGRSLVDRTNVGPERSH